MSFQESQRDLHLHLGNTRMPPQETEDIQDKFKNYVIDMNRELQSSCQELRNELAISKTQIDELEDRSDNSEKSTTYMRGLIKNFSEIDIKQSKIILLVEKQKHKNSQILAELRRKNRYHIILFRTGGVAITAISIIMLGITIAMFVLVVLSILFVESLFYQVDIITTPTTSNTRYRSNKKRDF